MGGLIGRCAIDRRGAIPVEYAIAVVLLGVAAVLAFAALGDAPDQTAEAVRTVTTEGHELSNEHDL